MKTIGLLGGMSWESTLSYYRLINQQVAARLGGFHSARLLLYSVDFHGVEAFMRQGEWDEVATILVDAGRALERAGAHFLVLCTNTMHKVADQIQDGLTIPLLHVVDATAERIRRTDITTVGLLGTRFTMEHDFYRGRLEARGLRVLVPEEPDRVVVHRVIFDELCHGRVLPASRSDYQRIIDGLVQAGAQGVILGCTEIAMLSPPQDSTVPLFDTTALHAEAAVDAALAS